MNFSGLSNSGLIGKLTRAPLRLIPKTAVLPILQGRLRGYRWIAGSSNHGCWLGSYEHDKQRFFEEKVTVNAVVYDVGANVGFYTLLAAELVGLGGSVIAFEPLPRNLGYLRRHVQLNRLQHVRIMDAAVSDRQGEAFFEPEQSPSMGHLAAQGSIRVRTVALDGLLAAEGVPLPDVIKIDVEGAELEVLKGAHNILSASNDISILIEVHHLDENKNLFEEIMKLLKNYGFKLKFERIHDGGERHIIVTKEIFD